MLRKLAALPLLLVVALSDERLALPRATRRFPGPRVRQALPLDELSHHASALALLWFALVWARGGCPLGLYARWARRRAAGRGAAPRPRGRALRLPRRPASRSPSCGRSRRGTPSTSRRACRRSTCLRRSSVLGAAVTAVGRRTAALAVVVAARRRRRRCSTSSTRCCPARTTGLLRNLTPDAVGPLTRARRRRRAVALLVAARGLMRRRRRAWQVAVAVAALSTTLHVLHGFNDGTLASVVILMLLVARRHDFDRPGDVATRRAALQRLAALAHRDLRVRVRRALDQPHRRRPAVHLPLRPPRDGERPGRAARRRLAAPGRPLRRVVPALAASCSASRRRSGWSPAGSHRGATACARGCSSGSSPRRSCARGASTRWRRSSCAPTSRTSSAPAVGVSRLPRRRRRRDRLGRPDRARPEAFDELIAAFVAHAHERDWRSRFSAPRSAALALYARHGLHALYHGDEAVVDVASFSLDGRAIRKVRQSVHRLERAGYTARVLRPERARRRRARRARGVARAWRGRRAGARLRDGARRALRARRRRRGLRRRLRSRRARRAASCTSRCRRPAARCRSRRCRACGRHPERVQRVADLRGDRPGRARHGYERVSLNFAPFAALLAPEAELSRLQEVQRRALLTLKGHFQLDNLLAVQPQVLPALAAALRRLRAAARPAAGRDRGARRRGVPAVPRAQR